MVVGNPTSVDVPALSQAQNLLNSVRVLHFSEAIWSLDGDLSASAIATVRMVFDQGHIDI